ncbi:MAG: hypothetical protein GIW98_02310 [Candidatus Eremiobacteraeota bacterium]|nr:hypothetical protein [Candidatus Eremiobacteraeota bacterium]
MSNRSDSYRESASQTEDLKNNTETQMDDSALRDRRRTESNETSERSATADTQDTAFLPADRMTALRDRWSQVQGEFVDDPRAAVKDAHKLVTELVGELTDTFSRERSTLETQWSGGGDADTEGLRVALRRYRGFFNRLLQT